MKLSIQDIKNCLNKHADWAKKHPIRAVFYYLVILWALSIVWWCIKPKYPDDIFFRPESFRFENYYGRNDFAYAARGTFMGMSIERAEDILVNRNGAIKKPHRYDPNTASYCRKRKDWLLREVTSLMPSNLWCVILSEDSTGKVIEIHVIGD